MNCSQPLSNWRRPWDCSHGGERRSHQSGRSRDCRGEQALARHTATVLDVGSARLEVGKAGQPADTVPAGRAASTCRHARPGTASPVSGNTITAPRWHKHRRPQHACVQTSYGARLGRPGQEGARAPTTLISITADIAAAPKYQPICAAATVITAETPGVYVSQDVRLVRAERRYRHQRPRHSRCGTRHPLSEAAIAASSRSPVGTCQPGRHHRLGAVTTVSRRG